MTTRREVPITGDTLAWVHNELAEIKSRLSLTQQAAEHSRSLAADASEKALQSRARVEQLEAVGPALMHLQDDLRAVRELLVRAQDDIHSLRQSREEIERRFMAEAERARQDRNEVAHRFAVAEREIEPVYERLAGLEENNRRHVEAESQLAMRIEALENESGDLQTLQSRTQTTLSRLDQDVQRVVSLIPPLQREDDVQRERASSVIEMLRRLEGEIDAMKAETNRISRIDDRVELVQAERTRHNERLNEITAELAQIESRLNEQTERSTLLEVRMGSYQEELRGFKERLQLDREQIAAYLHSLNELASDMRKRRIIAMEKEIRDIRGQTLTFAED
jgi:chromosome segregation ATPase